MNTTRAIINLSEVKNFNQNESFIFSIFFSEKGKSFSKDLLLKKVSETMIQGDKDEVKETKRVKALITKVVNKLIATGIISKNESESKSDTDTFKMESYDIKDLEENRQLLIGGKAHTSLTSNGSMVVYKNDTILYMTHPVSQEFKLGQRVGTGVIKDFHINEEGFRYAIVTKPAVDDAKPKTCAVKLSQAQLLDTEVPVSASECVKYKSKAGLTKPTIVPVGNCKKGNHILFFNAEWSDKGLQMTQMLKGMGKVLKGVTIHPINTDHQVDVSIAFNIRFAPTLVIIKDGKEVARLTELPNAKDVNKATFDFIKKALK